MLNGENSIVLGPYENPYFKLLESAQSVLEYVEKLESGDSYWVDDDGKTHTADMGYAMGFLEDLVAYLESKVYISPYETETGNFDYRKFEKCVEDSKEECRKLAREQPELIIMQLDIYGEFCKYHRECGNNIPDSLLGMNIMCNGSRGYGFNTITEKIYKRLFQE